MKTSIYLPDDFAKRVCVHRVSISQVAQAALRIAVQATTVREEFDGDFRAALSRTDERTVHEVLEHAGAGLGRGVAMLLNLLSPTAIVFYGPDGFLAGREGSMPTPTTPAMAAP